MVTLNDIEETIVTRVQSKLSAAAGFVAAQRGIEGIPQPAVYVSIEEGSFRKITSTTWEQAVTCFVDIVFSNLQNEAQRRKGIYAILEGVVQCLLMQKLGLDIAPLAPKSFRNITSAEHASKGLIVYEMEFNTSCNISKLDEEETTDLLEIGLSYYLQDPTDDDIPDAADTVTLNA
jgi:hypothetical protein